MYGDELTMVYDAYSLSKTGMDQTGDTFPLTFKMGAGRPAGYVYSIIPFVNIFGPTELGVRSMSLISGMGIIILMFFLGKKLFDDKIGLIASFLSSISLWDIYLSRGGFEAHMGLLFALLGIVMFLYKKYVFFAVAWGIAIFTYPTFKLTLPVIFLLLLWFFNFKKILKNKKFYFSIVILLFFGVISLFQTVKGVSEERFLRINVFSNSDIKEKIIQKVNEQRNLSVLPEDLKIVLYNKPLSYSKTILANYMENISPVFFYLKGDGNPRHNPGEWGMLYLVELPLLFIGLYNLFNKSRKNFIFLIVWILITPLASMLIPESAHGLRNNLMFPAFILISSYAIFSISKKWQAVFVILMLVQLTYVLLNLYFFVPYKFGSFWSEKAKKASIYTINKRENYENIILSTKIDNIEYAYQVYAKIDPYLVISEYGNLPKVFDNVIITDKPEGYKGKDSTLILTE